MCLTCPNPFKKEEKMLFTAGQLSTDTRFQWIKEFLEGRGEISDEELGEYIRTLLPKNPEELKSSIRMFGWITPNNDEEKRLLQRIQKICASM